MDQHSMIDDTDKLLSERGKTHGPFDENARVDQCLKEIARSGVSWPIMTYGERLAVEMILHKVSRIVSGNPSFADHWCDIQGYARLGQDS